MKKLLVLLCSLFTVVSCTPKLPAVQGAPTDCVLVYAEGRVTMDGKEISIGAKIINGALLKTDGNGIAEMVFNDKNIVKMGPLTVLRLDTSTLKRVVSLESGTFTAVLRKLDKLAGGTLEVRTPTAIAGVRGTSFFARVNPSEGETYFCACNGTLKLSTTDGSLGITKSSYHHNGTIFSGDPGDVKILTPPSGFDVGHTDKDLEDLASRIEETMDWSKLE